MGSGERGKGEDLLIISSFGFRFPYLSPLPPSTKINFPSFYPKKARKINAKFGVALSPPSSPTQSTSPTAISVGFSFLTRVFQHKTRTPYVPLFTRREKGKK